MAVFLTSNDVALLLEMDDYIEAMERAYDQLGRGESNMLPRIKVNAGERAGFMKILPASLSETGMAGIHVYTGGGRGDFLKVIFLFDILSGNLEAVIESDRIGWLVPGAVSAVATKYLSREDARILAVLGAGRQARSQLLALSRVRKLEHVKVFSPQREHREAYCKEMGELLNLQIVPLSTPEEAIKGAHIISAATNAHVPLFDGNRIGPGVHINAIGAHDPKRREVDGVSVRKSKVIVDALDRALQEEGALILAAEEGMIEPAHVYGELGEIVSGRKEGRADNREITLFLSGATSIEYVALGIEVYRKAQKKGLGQQLHLRRDEGVPRSHRGKTRSRISS